MSDSETQQMLMNVGFRSSTQPTCLGIFGNWGLGIGDWAWEDNNQ
ncbi:MAG: hypothetical protein AAFY21_22815 [Cyanobacteria bacterium J06641_2]